MIDAQRFLDQARERGFRLYTGVPCSFLKPLINAAIDSERTRYVGAANEGDAIAIGAGAELGGLRSVVLFQNSGLGNALNPLTSLTHVFRIPLLLIPTLRGDPEGAPDEPQHALMGEITTKLLELLEIPWEFFPTEDDAIGPALARASAHLERERRPFALVLCDGTIAPRELATEPSPRAIRVLRETPAPRPAHTRREMLAAVQQSARASDILVATTGYTGRELYALADRPNQLYMVGSMGCASSLALGLALARPERRVIVLDGDGAALMRLGALATIGYERPANLLHVLLDNRAHESTGGQSTVSHSVSLPAIAAACGYERIGVAATPGELAELLAQPEPGLAFLHVPIRPGVGKHLPRPEQTPEEVAERLRRHLAAPARAPRGF